MFEATTAADGDPSKISLARFGPESTPIFLQQLSSFIISLMRLPVPFSKPFDVLTIIWSPSINFEADLITSLTADVDTATNMTSHSEKTSSKFVVA